jgi:hypothetical protein
MSRTTFLSVSIEYISTSIKIAALFRAACFRVLLPPIAANGNHRAKYFLYVSRVRSALRAPLSLCALRFAVSRSRIASALALCAPRVSFIGITRRASRFAFPLCVSRPLRAPLSRRALHVLLPPRRANGNHGEKNIF